MTNPGISILIRTYNSAGTLPAVLSRLAVQPADEIIVVDSGSGDATLAIAQKNSAHILVAEKPFNYSRSLNLGFAAAKNPWVLVISSHCVPSSQTLVEIFREVARNLPATVNVAYGECSLVERHDLPEPPTWSLADKNSDARQRREIYGGNGLALYRRAAWQVQPFDEALPTGEDLAWFLHALAGGGVAARVPQASVLYRNQGSLRHMFRKGWQESRMAGQLTGAPAMSLWQLGIGWGSLLKKWVTGKIPVSSLLRQCAHALGAYLAPKFSGRPNRSSPTEPRRP
jgi:glycosyltransferase involved in cell wall biosynthesis